MTDLARIRERLALAVTASHGQYVSAFVDEYAADDLHAVVRTLERLRRNLATTREAREGLDPARLIRLRVEWVDLQGRRVLLFVMGSPS